MGFICKKMKKLVSVLTEITPMDSPVLPMVVTLDSVKWLFHMFRFRVKRFKPSKVTVCYDSMHRMPCEKNYPCVHGTCQLTLINTTFCFCDFPYNGETCNTTVLFWTTSFVLIISVAMILVILNVRLFKLNLVFQNSTNVDQKLSI